MTASMNRTFLTILFFGLLATGCSTLEVHKAKNADLRQYKRAYVLHLLTDGHGVDEMVAAELRAHGLQASAGPLTMMPDDTELLVEYRDEWAWDFKNYLIGMDIQIKKLKTDEVIGTGHLYRPRMVLGAPPSQMVSEVLSPLFK